MSTSTLVNTNIYDDARYTRGVVELQNAVSTLWDAGGSADDIEEAIANAIEEASDYEVAVTIAEIRPVLDEGA